MIQSKISIHFYCYLQLSNRLNPSQDLTSPVPLKTCKDRPPRIPAVSPGSLPRTTGHKWPATCSPTGPWLIRERTCSQCVRTRLLRIWMIWDRTYSIKYQWRRIIHMDKVIQQEWSSLPSEVRSGILYNGMGVSIVIIPRKMSHKWWPLATIEGGIFLAK